MPAGHPNITPSRRAAANGTQVFTRRQGRARARVLRPRIAWPPAWMRWASTSGFRISDVGCRAAGWLAPAAAYPAGAGDRGCSGVQRKKGGSAYVRTRAGSRCPTWCARTHALPLCACMQFQICRPGARPRRRETRSANRATDGRRGLEGDGSGIAGGLGLCRDARTAGIERCERRAGGIRTQQLQQGRGRGRTGGCNTGRCSGGAPTPEPGGGGGRLEALPWRSRGEVRGWEGGRAYPERVNPDVQTWGSLKS